MVKITQDDESKDPSVVADEEIVKFDRWLVEKLKTNPMIKAERAMVKTYLVWKLSEPKS